MPRSLPLVRSAFILALIVIFILAMIPLPEAITVFSFQDKVEHTGAFIVLMLLGGRGWPARLAALFVGLVGYGLAIELCQHFLTANRVGDPWDLLADALGAAAGWALMHAMARRGQGGSPG
ncbi:hypothetical protein [Zoogloea sp.]|uniref:hypothetical protein n=1 Tax=Zoogloea sp. TaxID=49181 RepID=UPI001415FE2A|nr:MAG: hypothetical protein F9K15_20365 [Zoogloea sp.]